MVTSTLAGWVSKTLAGIRLRLSGRVGLAAVFLGTAAGVCGLVYQPVRGTTELPNRIPEAAPYVTSEAQFFPPPFEEYWQKVDHPGQCQSCHARIFDEWNGSMMSNAWRDPVWRAAFLLSARQTSTDGDCAAPAPPDGSARAHHNPFASPDVCASIFDIGRDRSRLARPGSLMDGFCSRCHMPANYVDNVPLHRVATDAPSGMEHAALDPNFNPISDNGTGLAFAAVADQHRNTDSGKSGVFCAICHTMTATRETPYHDAGRSNAAANPEYVPARGAEARQRLIPERLQDILEPPDPAGSNLGYAVGSGSFRLSPHAIGFPERVGPLTAADHGQTKDAYLSGVFKSDIAYEHSDSSKHHGYYHALVTRAEMCSACHDVTNPLTIKNRLGKWVGGFPIERTYTEWASSRYADRPGNRNFDPAFKRDCQTCHMQQDYGQPGTAQTLYQDGAPRPPARGPVASDAPARPYFTHHFVGGNAYITRMIGADVDDMGTVQPYPQLSIFSFSSADARSPYANAFWTGVERRGRMVQQARLAWDRLRHVLSFDLSGPTRATAGTAAPLRIRVTNTGSGHKFPTGFPEGRIAWVAVHAFDLATGRELPIRDRVWQRTSIGVGNLTAEDTIDPSFPGCQWHLPAGSVDPYAYQFKAVASLGDGCPTLDLVYAHPLNLVTNARGEPVDRSGASIDRHSPASLPQYRDLDGDGDLYNDAFLRDTRLQPLPLGGATADLDRYSVVVPLDVQGPIAVTAAVYYQSVEGVVAQKLLGNLADTNGNLRLEPCVLGGACDGRVPDSEPAVVEGAPPVPMGVRNWVIQVEGGERGGNERRARDEYQAGSGGARHERMAQDWPGWQDVPLVVSSYPPAGAEGAFLDAVVKVTFSQPVRGVSEQTFMLEDSQGTPVPASVDQIGDGTWALFPTRVFLKRGETYTARLEGVCGVSGVCLPTAHVWRFRTVQEGEPGRGDTRVPSGFPGLRTPSPLVDAPPPAVAGVRRAGGTVQMAFSASVMNVTPNTVFVWKSRSASSPCTWAGPAIPGRLRPNTAGDVWTFFPDRTLEPDASYCVGITQGVYDLSGAALPRPTTIALK